MPKINKKEFNKFVDAIFGTDQELKEGQKRPGKPKLKESVMIQGTLFSKDKWSVERIEE